MAQEKLLDLLTWKAFFQFQNEEYFPISEFLSIGIKNGWTKEVSAILWEIDQHWDASRQGSIIYDLIALEYGYGFKGEAAHALGSIVLKTYAHGKISAEDLQSFFTKNKNIADAITANDLSNLCKQISLVTQPINLPFGERGTRALLVALGTAKNEKEAQLLLTQLSHQTHFPTDSAKLIQQTLKNPFVRDSNDLTLTLKKIQNQRCQSPLKTILQFFLNNSTTSP